MKICGIICEYNPFHNGHEHHIREAKRLSGADLILCVMSGNFVQRGESAIFEKHLRAKHAVLAGADAVIELPVHFATSNAELFAKGAIKLLASIPSVTHICFGAERADKNTFIQIAQLMNNEPQEVSLAIKQFISQGESYAKARAKAFSNYIPENFLNTPNNTLGVEYTKALLTTRPDIEILPIQRIGSGYVDKDVQENFSSATAIRLSIERKEFALLKNNLPKHVYEDLEKAKFIDLSTFEKLAILSKSKEEIASTLDCTEGLENAFKRIATTNMPNFVEELTSARYTSSRIKRIALQNLLSIQEKDIRTALVSSLYIKILAIRQGDTQTLSALGASEFPLLVKNSDEQKLKEIALNVFEKEKQADCIYSLLHNEQPISYSPFF